MKRWQKPKAADRGRRHVIKGDWKMTESQMAYVLSTTRILSCGEKCRSYTTMRVIMTSLMLKLDEKMHMQAPFPNFGSSIAVSSPYCAQPCQYVQRLFAFFLPSRAQVCANLLHEPSCLHDLQCLIGIVSYPRSPCQSLQ